MQHDDTIAAIATPLGSGGIGIVRISGSEAKSILQKIFRSARDNFTDFRPWTLHRGHFIDAHGAALDDILAVFMPGPSTFTGEDVAEIHAHGGQVLMAAVLEAIVAQGARLAAHGEFSRRALLNGRMDLIQAEAVAEMIAAKSKAALHLGSAKLQGLLGKKVAELRGKLERLRMEVCVAVDFPEEEVECLSPQAFGEVIADVRAHVEALLQAYTRGRHWQEGASVVLAGAVNAGKSSLLNALLGYNRALVTDIPGTTRDFLEEGIQLDGLAVRIIDTAGLREALDTVERMGIERSRERIATADAILFLLDGSLGQDAVTHLGEEGYALAQNPKTILVWNKGDIAPTLALPSSWQEFTKKCIIISAKEGQGLTALAKAIKDMILQESSAEPSSGDVVPNMRQALLLQDASAELTLLLDDITSHVPYDICSVRLDTVVALLGQITGLDSADELLDKIFANFCIGK